MIGDPLANVVDDLAAIAAGMDTRALLVGAYARDRCLDTTATSRGTRDVDFAVMLNSWGDVDAFFKSCDGAFRDADVADLKMYHRATGVKVDVVPCGQVESPPGTLALRESTRRLNTLGLAECFELARPLHADCPHVLVPPPEGFLLLKLFAFADRRAPRDLRDVGYVLHRFPVDRNSVWVDSQLMSAFDDGTLDYDDLVYWTAGRAIATAFSGAAVSRLVEVVDALLRERPFDRVLLVDGIVGLDADARLTRADRSLAVLHRALAAERQPAAG